jgi:hypothetical protein
MYPDRHDSQRDADVTKRLTVADTLRLMGYAAPDKRGFFLCAAHADRTPSAHVVADHAWTCFSCGAKGGILDLVVLRGFARDKKGAAEWLKSLL